MKLRGENVLQIRFRIWKKKIIILDEREVKQSKQSFYKVQTESEINMVLHYELLH